MTDAGIDLRGATDEKLQDLKLALRALVGLCFHHDCGRPAALSDTYRLVREGRPFDDARRILAQIRDGD